MEDYYKIIKKRRIGKYITGVVISILIVIIIALSYLLYINIYVEPIENNKYISKNTLNSNKNNINNINRVNTENKADNIKLEKINKVKKDETFNENSRENKNISDVLENVNQSIVGISKIKNLGKSVLLKDSSTKLGMGTGMIVSENGYILTNEHVSGGRYSNCYVTLIDGRNYKAEVVWADKNIDLSIMKINAKNLQYVKLGDSSKIKIGQKVYAIGNPIGFEFNRTVTSGIVSGIDRSINIVENDKNYYMDDLIQTDATINPGNSGGPLIDINGDVIGINSVKVTSAEGIGFAISINTIKPVIQSFIENNEFIEAYLGIFAYDKNVIPYLDYNLKLDAGIYVVQVNKNSAAEKYGIKENDILLNIDGYKLDKMSDLRRYIYTKKPGDSINFDVIRNNKEFKINVVLDKK